MAVAGHLYGQLGFCACSCLLPAWWVQIPPLAAPFSAAFLLRPLCSRTIPLRMISNGATVATQRIGNNRARIGFSMGRCRVGLFIWQFSIPTRSHQGPTPMMPTALLQEVLPSCHSPSSWEVAQVPRHPWNCLWFKTMVVKLPAGCITNGWVWKEPFCSCKVLDHNRKMLYGHGCCGLYGCRMGTVLF